MTTWHLVLRPANGGRVDSTKVEVDEVALGVDGHLLLKVGGEIVGVIVPGSWVSIEKEGALAGTGVEQKLGASIK